MFLSEKEDGTQTSNPGVPVEDLVRPSGLGGEIGESRRTDRSEGHVLLESKSP